MSIKARYIMLFLVSGVHCCYSKTLSRQQVLIEHVKKSIDKASKYSSKLDDPVLKIEGMSSPKVRHLLNNLCSLPNTRYFEIGTFKGSTYISANYKNEKNIRESVAVDNWSKFGGPKAEFLKNAARFIPKAYSRLVSQDSFSLKIDELFKQPVTVYFYDGDHSAQSQGKAFTYFDKIFDTVFIAVVDDWNRTEVREGTQKAFKELRYKLLYSVYLKGSPEPSFDRSVLDKVWWQGLFVAVIQKAPTVEKKKKQR